jgi:hypothetical protein
VGRGEDNQDRRTARAEPTSSVQAGAWLRRTGYLRRIQIGERLAIIGLAVFVVSVVEVQRFGFVPLVAGWLAAALGSALAWSIRCRVCGSYLRRSEAGGKLTSRGRTLWLARLKACPVCGDDGLASPESRQRWVLAGAPREIYWSKRRVITAIVATIFFVGGGIGVAILARQHWLGR